jgi:hypothetical protein
MYHHHVNVKKCARRIINLMEDHNELICYAPMQAGKTEVMYRIIELMKNDDIRESLLINPKRIYILIAASSTPLKQQLINHIPGMEDRVYHLNDLVSLMAGNGQKIISRMICNSLFLIDECHSNLNNDSVMANWRKLLECGKNSYIVGFSATPYEQVVGGMPIISLTPMQGYYGIDRMFQLDRIKKAVNLTKLSNVKRLFTHFDLKDCHGYAIIRLPNNIEHQILVKTNISRWFWKNNIDMHYITYDRSMKHNLDTVVSKKPDHITIIYVKDRLKMGETLDTKYVFLVHDYPHNESTNTTVQSLLGRCCGYNKENDDVLIYCDVTQAFNHFWWVDSGLDKTRVPTRTKYIYGPSRKLKQSCMIKHL